jgi:hypothetical protein
VTTPTTAADARPAAETLLAPVAPPPMRPNRQPSAPTTSPPATPVVPPAFPPVDDDPFAPAKPAAAPITASPTAARPEQLALDMLPGADGRLPVRAWTDASGQFRVKARLSLILDGKVRLLKETGRTTTVAIERLSPADRAYIAEIIARYGNDLTTLDQLAAR